jgi:hypothetical protein
MRLSEFPKSLGFSRPGFLKIIIPFLLALFIVIATPAVAQDATGAKPGHGTQTLQIREVLELGISF